jgi:hypothetical protein
MRNPDGRIREHGSQLSGTLWGPSTRNHLPKYGWRKFFANLEQVLARMIGDWYLRKTEKQPNEVQTI